MIRNIEYPNIGETLEDAQEYRRNKNIAYEQGYTEFMETAVPVVMTKKQFMFGGKEYA